MDYLPAQTRSHVIVSRWVYASSEFIERYCGLGADVFNSIAEGVAVDFRSPFTAPKASAHQPHVGFLAGSLHYHVELHY